ncbi:hypothetical protein ACJIZ3_023875 [Penstemon smallii]|uniref:KIB1-4 beta-propeller domain-containing protein n=1 Tax=Penstemon smallii TaxID=265156 RepID=A0ABD3TQ94_9LAMI
MYNFTYNIRASAVCKSWLAVAISVRISDKPPWLMFFPKFGDLYEFYDPSKRKTYWLELPELHGSRICYAKDGWLLLCKPRTQRVFFFCPYTREMIKMPNLELTYQIVAFSASPTSPDCMLFTVKHVSPTVVAVSTCRPGATEWTTISKGENISEFFHYELNFNLMIKFLQFFKCASSFLLVLLCKYILTFGYEYFVPKTLNFVAKHNLGRKTLYPKSSPKLSFVFSSHTNATGIIARVELGIMGGGKETDFFVMGFQTW